MKKSIVIYLLLLGFCSSISAQLLYNEPYDLNTGIQSRSISFENPIGERGQGGKASSNLGIGRKGSPAKTIAPNEEVVLCDIKGAGTIRHIWMTGAWKDDNRFLRSTVIRAYWEGQEHPSIECPLGDFMGLAHGKVTPYQSSVHSVGEHASLNIWLPMPFASRAKITFTNESDEPCLLFYQIDYTINDKHNKDIGRLHVCFRRENPTVLKEDFVLLPKRTGKGRFIGTVIGVRTLNPDWWGEGEVKIYMDGDTDFPTICGTGSEDYVGLSYGIQKNPFLYHGCNLILVTDPRSDSIFQVEKYSGEIEKMFPQYTAMYRWHLPDPIYWEKECRVTIQQIGWDPKHIFERQDDWSCATFWFESVPSEPLPEMPSKKERMVGLDELFRFKK